MHVLDAVVVLGCRIYVSTGVIARSRHVCYRKRVHNEFSESTLLSSPLTRAVASTGIAWHHPTHDKGYGMHSLDLDYASGL